MERSKHTSGMWETIDHNETPTIIANMDGWVEDGRMRYAYDVIAQCCDEFGDVLPNAHANARLIEAAPDMLAALENMERILWDLACYVEESRQEPEKEAIDACVAARRLIAKAKGAN